MPLFEYRCRRCAHCFEALVRGTTPPACPLCENDDLERLVSLFAATTEGTQQSTLQTARRKNATTVRDQRMADHEYKQRHQH
jgi:putative FmdB family regulatory protein